MGEDTSVRVALRVRPQIPREIIDMCRVCTSVVAGEPQVWLGNDKAFTFDYVFDMNGTQNQIYENCVLPLIEGCFDGFNATVLAYGQTGSGKTYTMGTGFDMSSSIEELGIIPRAVDHLFQGIEERQQQAIANSEQPPEFKVVCQFMELYNEEVIDLFDTARDAFSRNKRSTIKIHEDSTGSICAIGLTSRAVTSKLETIQCLKLGALSRTTASTQMNVQSSRSHAVFTLHIKQQRVVKCKDLDNDTNDMNELETLTAKFHFVDLAGSERLKRTGATGERAKEGISINCGLLALGNVISALGDKTKRGSHVPYRDSKLTRLLQDSLGGNSRTVMIACISPSDRDFMETLNTLKYANRTRNIKNRITVNQDKTTKTIASLRMEIQQLQLELMEYKQGKRMVVDGVESINDMYHENTMLQTENNNLRTRLKAMQETIEQLTVRNTQLLAEKATGEWITSGEGTDSDMTQMIHGYLKEVEELRAKFLESENTCLVLRRTASRTQGRPSTVSPPHPCPSSFDLNVDADDTMSVDELIGEAKMDIVRLRKREKRAKLRSMESEKENVEGEERDDGKSDDDENTEGMDDDISISSETDSEDKDNAKYEEDLAELTCEISIKQKLIEELEKSQRRLHTMRQQYEDKLMQLQTKIRNTQDERDKVLSSFAGNSGTQTEEKAKKVKEEYEKKINNLNNELKKLQEAKKRHAQLVRSQSQYEQQLKQLKNDLTEMKKNKVRLLNKMKEDASKHKESEVRRTREIAQLKKESRVRENQIRSLEAGMKLKETVLRRKQEEVSALRKIAKPMSDRVAGRTLRQRTVQYAFTKKSFSPKLAKHKWQTVEKEINKLILNRQAITNLEKDMERWLEERERRCHHLEKFIRRRDKAILEHRDDLAIKDMEDQIETVKANIDYIQENISECQTNIMQMEEPKEGNDTLEATTVLAGMGFEEVKYLVEKLLMLTINNGTNVSQKESSLKAMETKMEQVVQSNSLHQQLLRHVLAQHDLDGYSFLTMNGEQVDEPLSTESSRSSSPVDSSSTATTVGDTFGLHGSTSNESLSRRSFTSKDKIRRRTATTEELLFAGSNSSERPVPMLPIADLREDEEANHDGQGSGDGNIQHNIQHILTRVPSAPGSLKVMSTSLPNGRPSPIMGRKSYDKIGTDMSSPRSIRKSSFHLSTTNIPSDNVDTTPPLSPNSFRRTARDDNVFSRLTSRTSINSDCNPDRGVISPYNGKMRSAPLICTRVAEGHCKAVLSVAATEDILFSASKDRTVKVWDLHTGMEVQSLENHPSNVVVVKYCELSRLAFSVSSSFVRVWDIRENPAKCVKTLSSTGLATNSMLMNNISRTQQPSTKEAQINDIALNKGGTSLFTASGNTVRIWDLRKFHCVGKLSGGHQAAVMCLEVEDVRRDTCMVVTGSKDHYIKVFEVSEGNGGMHTPKLNLEPPHYDGIESLALTGQYLFSGSRDMCIKKWDLSKNELKQSLNQAHKDWVCGLCLLPGGDTLLSGCRGGYIKLWSVDTCALLGEIKAHASPINAITTNASAVFTASSDGTIGLWRMKNFDSPELSDAN